MSAHIRMKALARGPRQTRDTYGQFEGDPQRKTLCGDLPTVRDLTWAETRHPNAGALKYVDCTACLNARAARVPANSGGTPGRESEHSASRTTNERLSG